MWESLILQIKCSNQLTRIDKTRFVMRIILVAIETANVILNIYIPLIVIDTLKNNNMVMYMVTVCGILLAKLVTNLMMITIQEKVKLRTIAIKQNITQKFIEHGELFPLEIWALPDFNDNYVLALQKSSEIYFESQENIIYIVQNISILITTISIMSSFSTLMLIPLLMFAVARTRINNLTAENHVEYGKKTSKNNRKLNYLHRLFMIPMYIKDFKINKSKNLVYAKKNEVINRVIHDSKLYYSTERKYKIFSYIIGIIEYAIVILVSSIRSWSTESAIGSIWVSINTYNEFSRNIASLFRIYANVYETGKYIEHVKEMKRYKLEDLESGILLRNDQIDELVFDNVSFNYPNDSRLVLSDCSFHIKKGKKILMVGDNGAGKSTIIKLIAGLYTPNKGRIYINNIEYKQYKLRNIRESVAIMFQDYPLYAFTLLENILFNDAELSDRDLNILENIGVENIVKRKSKRYKEYYTSQYEDEGVELSGGEAQRIAIARCLLKKASMKILDEPTNHLDEDTIKKMCKIIKDDKNTYIIISHDKRLEEISDSIYLVENGSVKELSRE